MSDERSSRSEDAEDKVVYGEKSLVPDSNTLAYHEGNKKIDLQKKNK